MDSWFVFLHPANWHKGWGENSPKPVFCFELGCGKTRRYSRFYVTAILSQVLRKKVYSSC